MRARGFGLRLGVGTLFLALSVSSCASLARIAQEKTLDLLPTSPGAGLYLNPGNYRELFPSLDFLVDAEESQVQELDRVYRVYLAQSQGLLRPGGQGGTLVLVHGRFPSFVIEWVFGTRFGMKSLGKDELFESAFTRHRVLEPGPRTGTRMVREFGDSAELLSSLETVVIFDEGTFGLYFSAPLFGSTDILGQIYGPGPWEKENSSDLVAWLRAPLDPSVLAFGLGGIEIELTRDSQEPREGWAIRADMLHLGTPEEQARNQRAFGSSLRLLTLGLARQELLNQDPATLRREARFESFQGQIPAFGPYALSQVDNVRFLPAQIEEIFRALTLFLEAP